MQGQIGLGQARLAVIDLSPEGNPPLSNQDGTLWIVFNGEIYNFQELRASLPAGKYAFKTKTDTEVLLYLYEEHGAACLQMLRGMFALAIWDERQQVLFAARDRLGKKPFYWSKNGQGLVFGSEIKALLVDPAVSPQPDHAALDAYLRHQYVPSPATAFQNIQKLPPGHWLLCDRNGQLTTGCYWQPPLAQAGPERTAEEVEEELCQRLSECVRLRMISDVPVGAFLSGGIDSGLVVALMAQLSPKPIRTFSVGFRDEKFNELPFARMVAERYATDHQELILSPDVQELLPRLVEHYNEPFADSSAVPSFCVAQAARQHVTVALTGDGGDESFGGYSHYQQVLAWQRFDFIPLGMRRLLTLPFDRFLSLVPYQTSLARVRRGLRSIAGNLPQRYQLQMSILKPEERDFLYTPQFRRLVAQGSRPPLASPAWTPDMDSLAWMMRHDQGRYLPDCLNVKTDVASMANSLELRSPFLDHRLVEFAAGLPSHLKLRSGTGKWILRRLARRLLPEPLLTKPKTGFSIPLASWLRGPLKGQVEHYLLDAVAERRGLFRANSVRFIWEEHLQGRRDWSTRLWELLMMEAWFRRFID